MEGNWIKYGRNSRGDQRWKNTTTKEVRVDNSVRCSIETKYLAIRMHLCGLSFRKCSEIVGVSPATVYNWFIKFSKVIKDTEDLGVDQTKIYEDVEIDEMWHYCKKKLKRSGYSLL